MPGREPEEDILRNIHADGEGIGSSGCVLGQRPANPFPSNHTRVRVGDRELATVLFTDFVASTERATEVGDAAWKAMLDGHERTAEEAIGRAGGRLIDKTGDGLLATFTGPSQAVSAACAVQDAALGLGVSVRAGIDTGEIERRGDRIGGIGVHIAARVMSLAQTGEVLASRTVRDLAVGSKLEFEDRGTHTLKGVSDSWQILAVAGT